MRKKAPGSYAPARTSKSTYDFFSSATPSSSSNTSDLPRRKTLAKQAPLNLGAVIDTADAAPVALQR